MAGRHTTAVKVERETFMLDIFKSNPGLSAAKANDLFMARFGSKMRVLRVYELRRQAAGPTPSTPVTVETVTETPTAETVTL
jgi:hypothetical protein